MRVARVVAAVGVLVEVLLMGCGTQPGLGMTRQAEIATVDPPTEQASNVVTGHTIRLNRYRNGLDALPSPFNESDGHSFTAPCGCIDLMVNGQRTDSKQYWQYYASVTFENSLQMGSNEYQAIYHPATVNPDGSCRAQCPARLGDEYTSGVLTVDVEGEGEKTYANRCDHCPAWCDPTHPNYDQMVMTHGIRCQPKDRRDVTISDVQFQSQLEARSCSPNYLCGYASTNMLTAYLARAAPTVEYMQQMALTESGAVCPRNLSFPWQYVAAAKDVAHAQSSFFSIMSFDAVKDLVGNQEPVAITVKYGSLISDKGEDFRCDTNWDQGHVLVVVGFDEQHSVWRVLDPLCKYTGGDRTTYAHPVASSALRRAARDALEVADDVALVIVARQ